VCSAAKMQDSPLIHRRNSGPMLTTPPILDSRAKPCDHVAVIHAAYADLILAGTKTMEARLSLNRQPPYGRVRAGDMLWFKASGGPFRARAMAARVEYWQDLRPALITQLRKRHNGAIQGTPEFWAAKRRARIATLIWLCDVFTVADGPAYQHTPGGRAWYVLDRVAR
jgi:hypothetical protein